MSDMSNLYKAYAAVHDDKVRDSLNEVRDEISEMTLTKLLDSDLQEIAEEIIYSLFVDGITAPNAEGLIECTLAEAAAGSDESEVRTEKITRLEEAFVSAFDKVTESAPVNSVEAFMRYRDSKPLAEKWYNRINHEHGNEKLHQSVVAQDRKTVFAGLQSMIQRSLSEDSKWGYDKKGKSLNPADKEEEEREDDELFGSPNKRGKKKKVKVKESRDSAGGDLDKEPPSWASMNPEDRGNPAYMKTSSLKDEEKWKRLQRMRKASKKKEVRAKANEEVQAELQEKDTYDQVAAVIDKDRAKKGTDYATYDSMHGKKKAAKRERDYAAFERKKMKRDAQRSGHPWEHAKGSTTEKEGKPSEKTKHVRDPQYNSYEPKGGVIAEKDLDAAERRALPDKDFALPGKGKGPEGKQAGSYPIPDKSHARMALAMVAKHGTPEEKSKVRAAVEKKFPGIKVSEEVQRLVNSERFSQEEILRLISD